MLNLINNMHENEAQYLRESDTERDNADRRLSLYLSHNDRIISEGYIGSDMVWFSQTDASDLMLSRRIFESMKQSHFYRKAKREAVLRSVNLVEQDFQYMCNISLNDIQAESVSLTGGVVCNNTIAVSSGVDFASIIAVLPNRLRSLIERVGSEDDILDALDKDYQAMVLIDSGQGYEDKIMAIRKKWHKAEYLKLSRRASIRRAYHDVCYFEKGRSKYTETRY